MLFRPVTVMVKSSVASLNFSGNSESLASVSGGAVASSSSLALPRAIEAGSITVKMTTLNIVAGDGGTNADPGPIIAVDAKRAASHALANPRIPAAAVGTGAKALSIVEKVATLNVKRNPAGTNTNGSGEIAMILPAYHAEKAGLHAPVVGGRAARVDFQTGKASIIKFHP